MRLFEYLEKLEKLKTKLKGTYYVIKFIVYIKLLFLIVFLPLFILFLIKEAHFLIETQLKLLFGLNIIMYGLIIQTIYYLFAPLVSSRNVFERDLDYRKREIVFHVTFIVTLFIEWALYSIWMVSR